MSNEHSPTLEESQPTVSNSTDNTSVSETSTNSLVTPYSVAESSDSPETNDESTDEVDDDTTYNEDFTEANLDGFGTVKLDYSLVTDEDRKNNPDPVQLANLVITRMGHRDHSNYNTTINGTVYNTYKDANVDGFAENPNNPESLTTWDHDFIGWKLQLYVQQPDGTYVKDKEFDGISEQLYLSLENAQTIWKYPNGGNSYESDMGQIDSVAKNAISTNRYDQLKDLVSAKTILDEKTGKIKVTFTLLPNILKSEQLNEDGEFIKYESYEDKWNRENELNYHLRTNTATFTFDLGESFKLFKEYAQKTGESYIPEIPTSFLDVDGKPVKIDGMSEADSVYTVNMPKTIEIPFYLDAVETVTEDKTVNRTINYVYEDGKQASEPVTQNAKFTRTGHKNISTGEIIWDAWSEAQTLDAVTNPTIDGYVPDKEISNLSVTADSNDIVDTVTYKADVEVTEEPVSFTRIVDYTKYDGKGNGVEAFPTVTQKVTGVRKVTTNKATGQTTIEYEWDNTNGLDKVDIPEIKGYYVPENFLTDKDALPIDWLQETVEDNIQKGDNYHYTLHTVVQYQPYGQNIKVNIIIDDLFDEDGNPHTSTEVLKGFSYDPLSDSDKNNLSNMINEYDKLPLDKVSSDLPDINTLVFDDVSGIRDMDDIDDSQVYNIHYKTKKEPLSETKKVTNTIKYVDEKGNQIFDTVNQELSFTKTGEHNLYTDETTWNDWTPEQTFESVTSPEKQGYTANIKVVENVTVNHESPNQETIVEYTPDIQRLTVNYIDKTTGETLKTDTKEGSTNTDSQYTTTDSIKDYESQGYVLDNDETNGQPIIFDDNTQADQIYNVYLSHKQEIKNDKSTINRVIHYVDQNGNKVFDDHIDTPITFTRDGVYDYVTKETTWQLWISENDTFAEVVSPVKTGYTPSQEKVDSQKVTPETSDIEETIVYAPNKQYMIINYIDDVTGKTLKTDTVHGETDQKSDYSTASTIKDYESQNYVLVSDDTNGKDLIFDDSTPVYNVHLSHKTETNTENVTLSDKWNFVYENGDKAFDSTNKEYTVTRDVTTDLVTGAKTYGEPSVSHITFDGFTVPTLNGYTATLDGKPVTDISNVNIEVDFDNPEHRENTIIYQADIQNILINFIDEITGKTLETKTFNGQTNSTLDYTTKDDINKYINDNYEFVSDETAGKTLQFDNDTNKDQVYNVYLTHKKENVTENHNVTRTINYVYADGTKAFDSITQGPATFTRTGIKDLVTGDIQWSNWSDNQEFDAVTSPNKDGYSVDIQTVDKLMVTPEIKDSEVTVVYHPTLQNFVVEYVDDVTGNIIHRDNDTGLTGDKSNYSTQSKIDELINKGYTLVSDDYKPVTFGPEINDKVYQVRLTHEKEDVTETKTITRVIKFVDEHGNELSTPETQTIELTRTGTKDKVTGEIIWDNPTDEFAEVSKDIDGYHTNEKANSETVNFDSEDSEVVIHYVKDEIPETPIENTEVPVKETPNTQSVDTPKEVKIQKAEAIKPETKIKTPAKQTDTKAEQELPQTGDTENSLAILGLTLVGMAGLAGASRKRKEN